MTVRNASALPALLMQMSFAGTPQPLCSSLDDDRRYDNEIPKPNGVRRWINVYTRPPTERDGDDIEACDVVGYLGYGWRNGTEADRQILSSGNHCDFRHMLSLVNAAIEAVCD